MHNEIPFGRDAQKPRCGRDVRAPEFWCGRDVRAPEFLRQLKSLKPDVSRSLPERILRDVGPSIMPRRSFSLHSFLIGSSAGICVGLLIGLFLSLGPQASSLPEAGKMPAQENSNVQSRANLWSEGVPPAPGLADVSSAGDTKNASFLVAGETPANPGADETSALHRTLQFSWMPADPGIDRLIAQLDKRNRAWEKTTIPVYAVRTWSRPNVEQFLQ